MAKGFVRLTGKYSEDSMYVKVSIINMVLPLHSIPGHNRTEEGSAVYYRKTHDEENYLCVLESPDKVMEKIHIAEVME